VLNGIKNEHWCQTNISPKKQPFLFYVQLPKKIPLNLATLKV